MEFFYYVCRVSNEVVEDLFRTPLKEPIPHQYSQCFDFIFAGLSSKLEEDITWYREPGVE